MNQRNTTNYLKDNPRMIGVLFAIGLAIVETGNAAANAACACSGP